MSRRFLHYTERRRRELSLKVARLERLESRSTVTPFTAFSLAAGAFQTLSQLGITDGSGSGNALRGPAQPNTGAQAASTQSGAAQARGLSADFLPLNIAPNAGGGGAPAAPETAAPAGAKVPADDGLTRATPITAYPSGVIDDGNHGAWLAAMKGLPIDVKIIEDKWYPPAQGYGPVTGLPVRP